MPRSTVKVVLAILCAAALGTGLVALLVNQHHRSQREEALAAAAACADVRGRQVAAVEGETTAMAKSFEADGQADAVGALRLAAAIEGVPLLTSGERHDLAAASASIVAASYRGDWSAAARAFGGNCDEMPLPKPWRPVLEASKARETAHETAALTSALKEPAAVAAIMRRALASMEQEMQKTAPGCGATSKLFVSVWLGILNNTKSTDAVNYYHHLWLLFNAVVKEMRDAEKCLGQWAPGQDLAVAVVTLEKEVEIEKELSVTAARLQKGEEQETACERGLPIGMGENQISDLVTKQCEVFPMNGTRSGQNRWNYLYGYLYFDNSLLSAVRPLPR